MPDICNSGFNSLQTLLSLDLFQQAVANGANLSMLKLNAMMAVLLQNNIAFNLSYTPGTGRTVSAIEMSILINPTTRFVIDFNFGPGSTAYTLP